MQEELWKHRWHDISKHNEVDRQEPDWLHDSQQRDDIDTWLAYAAIAELIDSSDWNVDQGLALYVKQRR